MLLCFFLSTLGTEGQLTFNPQKPGRKPGRSFDEVSVEPFYFSWVAEIQRILGKDACKMISTQRTVFTETIRIAQRTKQNSPFLFGQFSVK